MRRQTIVFILLFLCMRCDRNRLKIEVGGYDFMYKGVMYTIESVTPNFLEGYNLLTRREGERIVLRGIDKEQDGVLDEVAIGNLSLEEAAVIYDQGIKAGEERGYVKTRSFTREFITRIGNDQMVLATYLLALGDIYNKLQIVNERGERAVAVDMGSDGRLDRVEMGDLDLERFQTFYEAVLTKGLNLQKIKDDEGLYIVVL